jgi:hypothetical protein
VVSTGKTVHAARAARRDWVSVREWRYCAAYHEGIMFK